MTSSRCGQLMTTSFLMNFRKCDQNYSQIWFQLWKGKSYDIVLKVTLWVKIIFFSLSRHFSSWNYTILNSHNFLSRISAFAKSIYLPMDVLNCKETLKDDLPCHVRSLSWKNNSFLVCVFLSNVLRIKNKDFNQFITFSLKTFII